MQKISFTLKSKKDPNQPTIILLYSKVNKQKLLLSTRQKVKPKDWNVKEQRVKAQKRITGHKSVNNRLNAIRKTCALVFEEMENEGISFTKDEAKNRIEIALGWKEEVLPKEVHYSLFDYLWYYCNRKERKDGCENTKTFKNTVRKLEAYNGNLNWEDVTMKLYHGFKTYLEDEELKHNTIGNHLNRIKIMVNAASNEGKTDIQIPKGWKRFSEQSDAIALTDEEVNRIYDLKLDKYKTLDKARDLFVIGCRTGLRSGNYLRIDPLKDIKGDMLSVSAVKGSGIVTIPLHWQVKEIMEKYDWELPSMTNQTLNRRIKEVALLARMNENVKLQFTKGGKRVTEEKKRYELVTSHTARRTFATWLHLNKVPHAQIMLLTGHKSLTEFMKYLRISREENAKKIADMPFFAKPTTEIIPSKSDVKSKRMQPFDLKPDPQALLSIIGKSTGIVLQEETQMC